MLYLGGKKSLFYGNRPKKMNMVGNSITELKSLNITIWKVFIKEFHLWCLCSPLFFVQCLICPLKLLCRIYSYMAFVLVFLFVCFCINSYIHLGEKRVRPSSQTQLGLDSWIQKFLPFHGLFIIIFRIYSVYYENYKDEIMLQVSIQVQLCCIVVTCRKPEQNRKRHYHQYFHQLP